MVSTIFSYGEDSLNNEFSVTLQLPSFLRLDNLDNILTFRAVGCKTPDVDIKTFTQNYRGYQIERWKPGREAQTTEITFRLDKYWRVYDAIYDWSNIIMDLEKGGSYADSLNRQSNTLQTLVQTVSGLGNINGLRGTMFINQTNISGDILGKGWTYEGIWPKTVPSVTFDATSDGSPQDVTISFSYISFKHSV